MRNDFSGFVKPGKQNKIRWINCLTKVTKYWGVQHHDRFACFNSFYSSETIYNKMITILRLVTTPLRHTIAMWKLNNNIINCLTYPWPNMLVDKWRFNTSQDLETLGDNINYVYLETIPNGILRALSCHYFFLNYLEGDNYGLLKSMTNQSRQLSLRDNN